MHLRRNHLGSRGVGIEEEADSEKCKRNPYRAFSAKKEKGLLGPLGKWYNFNEKKYKKKCLSFLSAVPVLCLFVGLLRKSPTIKKE